MTSFSAVLEACSRVLADTALCDAAAKDVIITFLKKKVKNLQETLAQRPVLSGAADNGVLTQTNGR